MDLRLFETQSRLAGTGKDLPHLSGPAAAIRQVLAAHFVRDCPHVVEIGGHIRPITPYLTHHPKSVTVIDPKTEAYEVEELNGEPCRVRHIPRKFQEVSLDLEPRSYGLVMLGLSLKPRGSRPAVGAPLFSLIDDARVVVVDYSPALERATSQVPRLIEREGTETLCSFELTLEDEEARRSLYAHRRFIVFRRGLT